MNYTSAEEMLNTCESEAIEINILKNTKEKEKKKYGKYSKRELEKYISLLDKRIEILQERQNEAKEYINRIENEKYREVIIKHYIKGKEWLQIEFTTFYSHSNLMKIRKKCIKEIDENIRKKQT